MLQRTREGDKVAKAYQVEILQGNRDEGEWQDYRDAVDNLEDAQSIQGEAHEGVIDKYGDGAKFVSRIAVRDEHGNVEYVSQIGDDPYSASDVNRRELPMNYDRAHAVSWLDARCVEEQEMQDGTVEPLRYAFQDGERWYVVDADVLTTFGAGALYYDGYDTGWLLKSDFDYDAWRDTNAVQMPQWWSPGHQEAWKQLSFRSQEPTGRYFPEGSAAPDGYRYERVAADLATGAEIAADENVNRRALPVSVAQLATYNGPRVEAHAGRDRTPRGFLEAGSEVIVTRVKMRVPGERGSFVAVAFQSSETGRFEAATVRPSDLSNVRDEANPLKEKIERAYALGSAAREGGKIHAPAQDAEAISLFTGESFAFAMPVLESWNEGWQETHHRITDAAWRATRDEQLVNRRELPNQDRQLEVGDPVHFEFSSSNRGDVENGGMVGDGIVIAEPNGDAKMVLVEVVRPQSNNVAVGERIAVPQGSVTLRELDEKSMVRVHRVVIDNVEGEDGKQHVFVGEKALDDADLYAIGADRPDLGYYKTDAKVTWENGEEFGFRFDLESKERNSFSESLFRTITFYGGVNRPSHFAPDRYEHFLNETFEHKPEARKAYQEFASKYQLLPLGAGRHGDPYNIPYPQSKLAGGMPEEEGVNRREFPADRPSDIEMKIARETLAMPDAMVGVMGGPTKEQAKVTLDRAALIGAAQYVGAEQVAAERFAYRDATVQRWHTMSGEELLNLERVARGYSGNIEDLAPWAQYALMPEWWSPEQMAAWRVPGAAERGADAIVTDDEQLREARRMGYHAERITADLVTGEEKGMDNDVNRRELPDARTAFAFALDYLGATEVENGRFAFYDHDLEGYWVVGTAEIAEFDRMLDDARREVREAEREYVVRASAPGTFDQDEIERALHETESLREKAAPERVYFRWASTPSTNLVEMPQWWSPDRRTAYVPSQEQSELRDGMIVRIPPSLTAGPLYLLVKDGTGPLYFLDEDGREQASPLSVADAKRLGAVPVERVTVDLKTHEIKKAPLDANRREVAMVNDDPNIFAEHAGEIVHLTFVENNALGSEFGREGDYRFIETEVGAQYNGGYRFVFEDENASKHYLFPFDIESYSVLNEALEGVKGLEIVRHRFSVTQGEVTLRYNGTEIGRFGDRIELVGDKAEPGAQVIGGWAGRGDAYWNDVAKKLIENEHVNRRHLPEGDDARAEALAAQVDAEEETLRTEAEKRGWVNFALVPSTERDDRYSAVLSDRDGKRIESMDNIDGDRSAADRDELYKRVVTYALDTEAAHAEFDGERNARRLMFHFEHGAYSYDPKIETRLEGRLRCAREAAAAEAVANERGWELRVEESGEKYAWQGQNFDVVREPWKFEGEMFTGYDVSLHNEEGEMLASLGGVTFKDDNEHEPYRDVLYAQLAEEALAEEDPTRAYVIASESEHGFWSNKDGWVSSLSEAEGFAKPPTGTIAVGVADAKVVSYPQALQIESQFEDDDDVNRRQLPVKDEAARDMEIARTTFEHESNRADLLFHFEHGAFSYGQDETRLEGRIRCAREAANAEAQAKERGWQIEVQEDGQRYGWQNGNFDIITHGRADDGKLYTGYDVTLIDKDGDRLTSLGGVCFDGNDSHEPYRRVLFAQLAQEALASEEREAVNRRELPRDASALQKAIAYTNAVAVDNGRYAVQTNGSWYTFSEMQIANVYRGDGEGGYKTIEELASDGSGLPMPEWWSPENRETWRVRANVSSFGVDYMTQYLDDAVAALDSAAAYKVKAERITVDASTGEKIVLESVDGVRRHDLERAFETLGAVQVERGRHAFMQGIDNRWWVAPTASLARWATLRDASGYAIDAPTNARYDAKLMPSWWTPERRFAVGYSTKLAFATREDAQRAFDARHDIYTADLSTGEEVVLADDDVNRRALPDEAVRLLERVEFLRAVQIDDEHFAYQRVDDELYYIVTRGDIGAIETWHDDDFKGVQMPKWWAPEHPQTYRDVEKGVTLGVIADWVSQGVTPFPQHRHLYERVGVDLKTGKEIVVPEPEGVNRRALPGDKTLARAVEKVGAVPVAPDRFVLASNLEQPHYVLCDAGYVRSVAFEEQQSGFNVHLPHWWTPEKGDGYILDLPRGVWSGSLPYYMSYKTYEEAEGARVHHGGKIRHVTVDLQNGSVMNVIDQEDVNRHDLPGISDTAKRLIAQAGGVEIAPDKWAVYQDGDGWYVGSDPLVMEDREENFKRGREYLQWGKSVWMPDWWTPERRETLRAYIPYQGPITEIAGKKIESVEQARFHGASVVETITADLETGKEVVSGGDDAPNRRQLPRFPIAHPIREVLMELGKVAQRGHGYTISYDAGRALLSAATDPSLDRDSVEMYLNRAEEELDRRIADCERFDLPTIRDDARTLRVLVRDVVGPASRPFDAILSDAKAMFGAETVNRRELPNEATMRQTYPPFAYSVAESDPKQVIVIKPGESGYQPFSEPMPNEQTARMYADSVNARLGITPAMRAAMEAGSMFGWDAEGAKPSSKAASSAKTLVEEMRRVAESDNVNRRESPGERIQLTIAYNDAAVLDTLLDPGTHELSGPLGRVHADIHKYIQHANEEIRSARQPAPWEPAPLNLTLPELVASEMRRELEARQAEPDPFHATVTRVLGQLSDDGDEQPITDDYPDSSRELERQRDREFDRDMANIPDHANRRAEHEGSGKFGIAVRQANGMYELVERNANELHDTKDAAEASRKALHENNDEAKIRQALGGIVTRVIEVPTYAGTGDPAGRLFDLDDVLDSDLKHGFSATYEIITNESAESGDAAESGYLVQNVSLREACEAAAENQPGEVESVEPNAMPDVAQARWVTWYRRPDNFRTFGPEEVKNTSLHFPEELSGPMRSRIIEAINAGEIESFLDSMDELHPDPEPDSNGPVNRRAMPKAETPAADAQGAQGAQSTKTREGDMNMADQAAQQKKHPTNTIYLTGTLEYDPKPLSTPNGTEKYGLRLKVTEPGYTFGEAGNQTVVPDKDHYFSVSVVGDKGRESASQLHQGDSVTVRGKAETYVNRETNRPAIGVTAFEVTQPTTDELKNPNRMLTRGKILESHVSERKGSPQFSFVEYKMQPFAAPDAKPTTLTIREYTPDAAEHVKNRQPGAVVALEGKWAIQVFEKQNGDKTETHTIATTPSKVQVLESERNAAAQAQQQSEPGKTATEQAEAVVAAAAAQSPAAAPAGANAKAVTAQVVREHEYMEFDGQYIGIKTLPNASGDKEPFAVVKDNEGKPFLFRDTDAFTALAPGEKAHVANGPDGLKVTGESAVDSQAQSEMLQINSDDLAM